MVEQNLSLGSVVAGALWTLTVLCSLAGVVARLTGGDDLAFVLFIISVPVLGGAMTVTFRLLMERQGALTRNAFQLGLDYGRAQSGRPFVRV